MATSTTTPMTIDPEAAALLASLGLEGPFQGIIDHGKRVLPGLRKIAIEYGYKYDDPENPTIVLQFFVDPAMDRTRLDQPFHDEFVRWFLVTYHPDTARHFLVMVLGDRS